MNIILNQPNHTSTATVLILESVKDLEGNDPLQPYALTKVITRDKVQHKFTNFDNKPLGNAGEVIDIVVTTNNKPNPNSNDEYYASASTVPSDFFQS